MDVLHVDPERGWGGGEVQVCRCCASWRRAATARGWRPTRAAGWRARRPRGRRRRSCRCRSRTRSTCAPGVRLRRLVGGPRRRALPHRARARAGAVAAAASARAWWSRGAWTTCRAAAPYARWLYNRAVDVVIAISDGRARGAACAPGVRADAHPRRAERDRSSTAVRGGRRARGAAIRAAWGVGGGRRRSCSSLGALERRKGHAVLLERPAGWLAAGIAAALRLLRRRERARGAAPARRGALGDRVVLRRASGSDVARLPRGGRRRGAAVAARGARRRRARGDGGGAAGGGEPRRRPRRGRRRRRDRAARAARATPASLADALARAGARSGAARARSGEAGRRPRPRALHRRADGGRHARLLRGGRHARREGEAARGAGAPLARRARAGGRRPDARPASSGAASSASRPRRRCRWCT